MVYLIRKIRTIPALRRFKIVVVTDRTDLEKQLSDTAVLTGEPLQRAKKVKARRVPQTTRCWLSLRHDSEIQRRRRLRGRRTD
jgi:hypothetical protein